MANSKFEYVRAFEQPDNLLANTWIVVRVDGRGFSKLTTRYHFTKPNDRRALDLMNAAARRVMSDLPDLVMAYGNSDEFSFVFHKDCTLFERRASKLTTTIVSTFTAAYMHYWPDYLPDENLSSPLPTFDGRAVCYPGDENLRHYMSWRQVDCHINNLYNTTFWALVQHGDMEPRAAEQALAGTVSSDKNEILFSRFGINYNNEPEIFKKGSVLYRDYAPSSMQSPPTPELVHPRPRQIPRPISQPLERSPIFGSREEEIHKVQTPRGPIGTTFLSTSTTPSPPPSPPSMSIPAFPFPNAILPVSPPGNGSTATTKQSLPALKPIPLPPPTLKPSTKPPASLNRPNLTARTNTSPLPSPIAPLGVTAPARTTSTSTNIAKFTSHSASASLSYARPATASVSTVKTLKHRSPSLSLLEGGGPPNIPLRISSIPLNNKPRKLSLPSTKSIALLPNNESSNRSASPDKKVSPPLRTMKELPSPPPDDPEPAAPRSENVTSPVISPSTTQPRPPIPPRARSHSRGSSAPPVSTSAFPSPPPHIAQYPHPNPLSSNPTSFPFAAQPFAKPSSSTTPPKANSAKAKAKANVAEEGGWAAGTRGSDAAGMSRTQREKEMKKRRKARIVIEHVDIIKDEFWERRPWILRGSAG